MRLHCSVCGRDVSTEVPDGTIVRAFIQCPDCINDDMTQNGKENEVRE